MFSTAEVVEATKVARAWSPISPQRCRTPRRLASSFSACSS
ncbi:MULTISPECIES: hypothetical protein [unclassified Streptomyces]